MSAALDTVVSELVRPVSRERLMEMLSAAQELSGRAVEDRCELQRTIDMQDLTIAALRSQNAELKASVAARDASIAGLGKLYHERHHEAAWLAAKVERLEARPLITMDQSVMAISAAIEALHIGGSWPDLRPDGRATQKVAGP